MRTNGPSLETNQGGLFILTANQRTDDGRPYFAKATQGRQKKAIRLSGFGHPSSVLIGALVVPAGWSGNVFAGEPYISRQYARHQPGIDVVVFDIAVTAAAGYANDAPDNFCDAATDNQAILTAAEFFSAAADVFGTPSAAADGKSGLNDGWVGEVSP